MSVFSQCWSRGLLAALCLSMTGSYAVAQQMPAQDQAALGESLALLSLGSQETVSERTDITVTESETPGCPATFDITYSLSSDYIFRGINRSEYGGEGREKPNHQLTTDLGVDIGQLFGQPAGTCGTLEFGTFFEWYRMQKGLNPAGGGSPALTRQVRFLPRALRPADRPGRSGRLGDTTPLRERRRAVRGPLIFRAPL